MAVANLECRYILHHCDIPTEQLKAPGFGLHPVPGTQALIILICGTRPGWAEGGTHAVNWSWISRDISYKGETWYLKYVQIPHQLLLNVYMEGD